MIDLNSVTFIGSGLKRPECVLCTQAQNIYTSNWDGGVTCIQPDGTQIDYLVEDTDIELKPNGFALLEDGTFLIAHLGQEQGGVYQLDRQGNVKPFLTHIEGEPLPPTNYVHLDSKGRIWITVSTRISPRALDYRPDANSGFIVLIDGNIKSIVADNLGYTNECVVDPTGQWLYVNETFARCLTRFKINNDGLLSNKEVIFRFPKYVFPDGLTFDQEGGIWITSIVSNQVIRILPDGSYKIILEDNDPEHLQWVEEAFQSNQMDRPHLDQIKSKRLKNISSLAFGGDDLTTAFLGCLLGDQIASFKTDVPGVKPVHWHFDD